MSLRSLTGRGPDITHVPATEVSSSNASWWGASSPGLPSIRGDQAAVTSSEGVFMPHILTVPCSPFSGLQNLPSTGTHATPRSAGLPNFVRLWLRYFQLLFCLESFIACYFSPPPPPTPPPSLFSLQFYCHSIRNVLAYVLSYRHQELSYVNEDWGGQSWEKKLAS